MVGGIELGVNVAGAVVTCTKVGFGVIVPVGAGPPKVHATNPQPMNNNNMDFFFIRNWPPLLGTQARIIHQLIEFANMLVFSKGYLYNQSRNGFRKSKIRIV